MTNPTLSPLLEMMRFAHSLTISGSFVTGEAVSVSKAVSRVQLTPKPDRMGLIVALAPQMYASDWYSLLGSLWFDCEGHSRYTDALRSLIELPATQRKMMCSARELSHVPESPTRIAVYRAATAADATRYGANSLVWYSSAQDALRHAQDATCRKLIRASVFTPSVIAWKQADRDSAVSIITLSAKAPSVSNLFTLSRSARPRSKCMI